MVVVYDSYGIFRKVRQFHSILDTNIFALSTLCTHFFFFSNRDLIMQATSLTGDQMNIINFCMSAASLVGCVISLAMLSGPGTEDLYREYLGKLSCCHFSLVSCALL